MAGHTTPSRSACAHSVMFTLPWSHLTTHFSERIPIAKQYKTVNMYVPPYTTYCISFLFNDSPLFEHIYYGWTFRLFPISYSSHHSKFAKHLGCAHTHTHTHTHKSYSVPLKGSRMTRLADHEKPTLQAFKKTPTSLKKRQHQSCS